MPAMIRRRPAPARDLDGEMDALVRMDAAEKDQVLTGAFLERVEREIDPVVDGRQIIQCRGAVGVADGDVIAVAIFFIDRHDFGRGEAMDGGQNRCLDQAAVTQSHEVVVAVNEVELGGVLERFRDVKVFGHLGIGGGVLLIALVDHGVEPGAGDRVPGGEQGHVPAARDQAFGEVAGHRLPGAVVPGRGPPGDRRQDRHSFVALDRAGRPAESAWRSAFDSDKVRCSGGREPFWARPAKPTATQPCRTELPPLRIVSISEAASSWAAVPPSVTSGMELRWATAASSRIALASVCVDDLVLGERQQHRFADGKRRVPCRI